jgi:protein TonB
VRFAAPVAAGDLSSSMIHAPPPRYPRESRRRHEQGTVLLAVLLATDGSVETLRIARSSGYRRLDEAALDAVQNGAGRRPFVTAWRRRFRGRWRFRSS